MSEQLLTTGDAARRLGVSSEFVRRLAREGKLSVVRTAGGQRIFSASDVEALAAERSSVNTTRREKAASAMRN